MSRKTILIALFLFLVAFVISGCTLTCNASSLEAPDLISPDWWDVEDGSAVTLEWSYPDSSCVPDEFEIILSQERDFSTIEITQLVPGGSTSWTTPALDEAEEYFWRVRAKVGSTYGPYSSELRSFFTLPYCTASDLYRATAVNPAPGGIFMRGYDSLEWEYPISSCIPESYRIELSTEPDFIDTSLNGGTGNPSTRWGPGSPLDPATQYFWRVTAYADGTWGPPTITYSFYTDPICSGASLLAPSAVKPLNWDIVSGDFAEFEWSYPDTSCAPEGFDLEISTVPDFSSIHIDAYNPNSSYRGMSFAIPFPINDCTTYYWRVAAVSEGISGPYSIPQTIVIDQTDSCTCDPATLPIPDLVSPAPYEIVPDLDPSLQWMTSGPCFPEGYSIRLNRFHEYSGPDLGGASIHPITSWGPAPLEPATQYWWSVRSGVGTDFSDYSSNRPFFTGPECASIAEVVAPALLAPADGATVDTLTPFLRYEPGVPGCIPDGYYLSLHMMADLSDPNLLGEFGLPGTTVIPEPPLMDCTTYYWSVKAVQDGSYGPDSPVWSFTVDVDGTCGAPEPSPGVPGTAKVNHFCREGTYPEYFPEVWAVEKGHRVLAIARNYWNTYLKLTILDQNTLEPFDKELFCWSFKENFEPGWPESPLGINYSFKDLPVEDPPEIPACHENFTEPMCIEAGGYFITKTGKCDCPK